MSRWRNNYYVTKKSGWRKSFLAFFNFFFCIGITIVSRKKILTSIKSVWSIFELQLIFCFFLGGRGGFATENFLYIMIPLTLDISSNRSKKSFWSNIFFYYFSFLHRVFSVLGLMDVNSSWQENIVYSFLWGMHNHITRL